jgi:hypothetical protein
MRVANAWALAGLPLLSLTLPECAYMRLGGVEALASSCPRLQDLEL